MTLSIRVRLLLWVLGGMAVVLILLATVIYGILSRSLVSGFDGVLEATAKTIAGSVEQTDQDVRADLEERELPEFYRAQRPDYFQLWREDGTVLIRSSSLKNEDLSASGTPLTPGFRPVRLPDGRPGRAISMFFVPKIDDEAKGAVRPQKVALVVARETAELDARIAFLRWLMMSATAGTIILGLAVGAVIVRQGLRPLDTLAAQISRIRQDELSTRISYEHMPSEIVPVVRTLNGLLERVEEAFRRERAFTADAAHELRTPLAGIRSTLELALARPRAAEDYRDAVSDCLDITLGMQAMVGNLLALARLEGGQTTLRAETVWIEELVRTLWKPLADAVRRRGISVEQKIPADLECTADRDTITVVLTNLLANAGEYTNDRGWIKIVGRRVNSAIELVFENSGCDLSDADAGHVFDRFWRASSSRTGTGLHCGLGLALVRRAAESLGGTVTAAVADGTFTAHLSLPSGPVA